MIKKKICYIITLAAIILVLILGKLDNYYKFENTVADNAFFITAMLLPSAVYVIYLLSSMKKLEAYFTALAVSLFVGAAVYWQLRPLAATKVDAFGLHIMPIVVTFVTAVLFAAVYGIVALVQRIIRQSKIRN